MNYISERINRLIELIKFHFSGFLKSTGNTGFKIELLDVEHDIMSCGTLLNILVTTDYSLTYLLLLKIENVHHM